MKKSQICCLRKDTCSKHSQNCFGNTALYLVVTSMTRDSRRHWEILDEECTLLKSIYQKVTFHQSGCAIRDPILEKADGLKRQSFLEWKNWCHFHWSAENKSWPELLHWSVEDFLTAWMSSSLSGQWRRTPAIQYSVTPRKSDATVSTTEDYRLHSCWWMGITFARY